CPGPSWHETRAPPLPSQASRPCRRSARTDQRGRRSAHERRPVPSPRKAPLEFIQRELNTLVLVALQAECQGKRIDRIAVSHECWAVVPEFPFAGTRQRLGQRL